MEERKSWRSDLVAAFSVALVALPLGLGLAVASDMPPLSGVISAIVGGLLTTFVRGSHVAINGPANALVVVVADGVARLKVGDDPSSAVPYLGAAFIVCGALQVAFGLLRLGTLAKLLPAAALRGMLAAIGLMICAKQAHVALGTHSKATSTLGDLLTLPASLAQASPAVGFISVVSLIILVVHPLIHDRTLHFIPAPMLVLAFAVPAASWLGLREHPHLLIELPDNLLGTLTRPDFNRVGEAAFWQVALLVTLVATLETLVASRAIDRLDPEKRKTDLNRDLTGMGLSTVVSGVLGGLPVITVIARSSVNVNHGARTRWSNFFHGLILLAFVALFPSFIQAVPLSALAALLIYTGYRLASPKIFRDTYHQGPDQLATFLVTLLATLVLGLIPGIACGVLAEVVGHWRLTRMTPWGFGKALANTRALAESREGQPYLAVQGVGTFLTLARLRRGVKELDPKGSVIFDLSRVQFVDFTTMDWLLEVEESRGGPVEWLGMGLLQRTSQHPAATGFRGTATTPPAPGRLTRRQRKLSQLAEHHGWTFAPALDWSEPRALESFPLFRTRPLEFCSNRLEGTYPEKGVKWVVFDVTFDEGVYLAAEEYHTTCQLLKLPFPVPRFTLQAVAWIDILLEKGGVPPDLTYSRYPRFPREHLVTGPDHEALDALFTPEVRAFFEDEEIYHLESNGSSLLVFKYDRLATPREIMTMIHYSQNLLALLSPD